MIYYFRLSKKSFIGSSTVLRCLAKFRGAILWDEDHWIHVLVVSQSHIIAVTPWPCRFRCSYVTGNAFTNAS